MSYLNVPRLHFAGQFQANVSTINNDAGHFWNAKFQPSYQEMQGPGMNPPNGWFSPQGDAAWRFRGCQITAAWLPSGPVGGGDPVLGCVVADDNGRVPAKLVDLDSEQQLVSEIWGLRVRISDGQGNTLLAGDFEPAAFMDIWDRGLSAGSGGDANGAAMWQSVLANLTWGNIAGSPFLIALRKASEASGLLSIKFNCDGINLDFHSPDFMCGRIVGTIGAAAANEPRHLVNGRQFMAAPGPNPNFFNPLGHLNFCAGILDRAAGCLVLDLGNALPTTTPGGGIANLGDLSVSVATTSESLGTIPATGPHGYTTSGWYDRTAGIVVLPLTAAQMAAAEAAPLAINGHHGQLTSNIAEWPNGAFVRADTYVYRMSPGDAGTNTVEVVAWATQWGEPLKSASITFTLDSNQLQVTPDQPPFVAAAPEVATPADVLVEATTGVPIDTTPPAVTTDGHGRAVLTLYATDPGNIRWFNNGQDYGIDGQVYGIRPAFTDPAMTAGPVNQWNFVSILVWSGFVPGNPVTGTDIYPIFQQYANLYPVMNRFLNLGDYDSVVAHARPLKLAFGLNPDDPNAMPVTRDLSPAKRAAILTWLDNPIRGTWPPSPTAAPVTLAAAAPHPAAAAPSPIQGGKTAAAARRLVLRAR